MPKLRPVEIRAKCIANIDEQFKNACSALKRNLPQFQSAKTPNDRECLLLGSGPTIKYFVEDIRAKQKAGAYIAAVKGSHEYMLDNGITPDCAIAVDPQAKIRKCFKTYNDKITYYIASQCHPGLFEFLKKRKLILWHLYSDQLFKKLSEAGIKVEMVGGGSTSGLRGLVLMYLAGFRKFHLYGFDSCLPNKGNSLLEKITGDLVKDKPDQFIHVHVDQHDPKTGDLMLNEKGVVHRTHFVCGKAMACQANEITKVLDMLKDTKVLAYGDGLIQEIIKQGSYRGRPDCFLKDFSEKDNDGFSPVYPKYVEPTLAGETMTI